MKKNLLISCLCFLSFFASATHYMGGEITWECLPNGNYRFILKLYRECYTQNGGSAATFGVTEQLYTTVPGLPQITMTRISLLDMSPECNPDPAFQPKIFCPGLLNGSANMGAMQEYYYTSETAYPYGVTLNGVPPAQGWEFSSRTCCRNPCTNINNASSLGFRLRAYMYSINGQNANPCYDSSPVFAEMPKSIICSAHPVTYNYSAFDPDRDSLIYQWGQPLEENGSPITNFNTGYSYTSPLPGLPHHPGNVAASLNSNTGEITFTSYTQGAFVVVVKITSYRCGQKISEVFREFQLVLTQGDQNIPPEIHAPFQDSTGAYTLFVDTVTAGDFVSFVIEGTDYDLMPDNSTPQTVNIFAQGSQFGAGYSDENSGCPYPPCAILTPPPTVSSQFSASTIFKWQTSCNHIYYNAQCPSPVTTYNFLFRITDDYCPVPSFISKVVTIVVKSAGFLDAPEIRCVETLDNGNVILHWVAPDNPDSTFNSYHIYYSINQNGPFQRIDSIFDISTTTSEHLNALGNQQSGYYYIKSRSGCDGKYYSAPSQIVRNIYLTKEILPQNMIKLLWNPPAIPAIQSNSDYYDIYKDNGTGNFSYLHSTLNTSATDYIMNNGEQKYRIQMTDSSGCVSVSNVVNNIFQDIPVFDENFSIYPNPFNEQITICALKPEAFTFAEITDLTGKVILRRDFTDSDCLTITDHNLSQGTYLLRINSINNRFYKIVRID